MRRLADSAPAARGPRAIFVATLALSGTLVVGGCTRVASSLSGSYDILHSQPTDAEAPIGAILVLADNHVHHLLSDATFFRSNWTDVEISPSAIRPPQLDLFGQDFLRTIFEKERDTEAVIHLGDAIDLGCGDEWRQFLLEMKAWPGPWVMAPGNHDAYFFGNFETSSSLGSWAAACGNGGGELMRKNRFVTLYLAALGAQTENAGLTAAAAATPNLGSWHCTACTTSFLQDVVWSVDDLKPWRSYVVQRVNLGYCRKRSLAQGLGQSCIKPYRRIDGILLDTATYGEAVGVGLRALDDAAGNFGDTGPGQARVIYGLLKEAQNTRTPVVLMGHHDYNSLSEVARGLIDTAIAMGSPFYASAHTHHGGYFVHGQTHKGWLELNLGSVLDWRPHYRRLLFFDGGGRLGMRAWYRPVEADIGACPVQNAWEPTPEAPDFFVRYTEMTGLDAWSGDLAQRRLADVILAALDRMFRSSL